ncbi:dipeptide epimerase [Candidatus Nitrospira bockiana]
MYRITRIEVDRLDVPITDAFVVATGRLTTARNLIVRLTLDGGAVGYGEIAPFPEVGGSDRESCERAAAKLAAIAHGATATEYRRLGRLWSEATPEHPAVVCGFETALLDALCRTLALPLWALWGGADVRARETDITIPITTAERTVELAKDWYGRGFRLLKTKVGSDLDQDLRRLEMLHRQLPEVAIIADANQGFTEAECRRFVQEARRIGSRLVLIEQPVQGDDIQGMAALRRELGIPIAADESARSIQDIQRLAAHRAADMINIKIMKSGLLFGIEMAVFARALGFRLMIGGMVETRVAMGCSFGLVLGLGGFEVLDLDTPLLLAADPVRGGYQYDGPTLRPWTGPGSDLRFDPATPLVPVVSYGH